MQSNDVNTSIADYQRGNRYIHAHDNLNVRPVAGRLTCYNSSARSIPIYIAHILAMKLFG